MSGNLNSSKVSNSCAVKKRAAGVLIPECPPANSIEINGPADYWFWEQASREVHKATYDAIIDNGRAISTVNVLQIITGIGDFVVTPLGGHMVAIE